MSTARLCSQTLLESMKTLIENFINGNLKDAKLQAKRYSLRKISDSLQADYGYSEHKAIMTAYYLKGQCSWAELNA